MSQGEDRASAMYLNLDAGYEGDASRQCAATAAYFGEQPRWPLDLDFFAARDIDYDADFSYRVAHLPEDDHAAWRLRYRVYCEETGFLPKHQHLSGYEYDHYDAHSCQSLVSHRGSGILAGTTRLILPLEERVDGGLPALEHAAELLRQVNALTPLMRVGEVSRFSIDPLFRNGALDASAMLLPGYVPSKAIPKILLGLAVACLDMALSHRITHLVAVIDTVLLRLLRRVGVNMISAGPVIDFYGLRQPAWVDVEKSRDELLRRFPQAAAHLS